MRFVWGFVVLLFMVTPAFAGWELYDDFSATGDGPPSSVLWSFTAGNVSVENHQMKLVFQSPDSPDIRPTAYPNDMNDVYGIRFDFRVASWSEVSTDNTVPKFRIAKDLGSYPDSTYVKAVMDVASLPHPSNSDSHHFATEFEISNSDYSLSETPSYNWQDLRHDTYIGRTRTMGAVYTEKGVMSFLGDRISKVHFDNDVTLDTTPVRMGIRCRDLGDEMTVYVDNVYVYRGKPDDFDTVCPRSRVVVVPLN